MARKLARNKETTASGGSQSLALRVREGLFILSLSLTLFFILALVTFHPGDPAWSSSGASQTVQNATGPIGAFCADILLTLFGVFAYGFPVMVGLGASYLFKNRFDSAAPFQWSLIGLRLGGFILALTAGCTLAHLYFSTIDFSYPSGNGGIIGHSLNALMLRTLHATGETVMLLATFLVGVTFATGVSWLRLMDAVGHTILRGASAAVEAIKNRKTTVAKPPYLNKQEKVRIEPPSIDLSEWVEAKPPRSSVSTSLSVMPQTAKSLGSTLKIVAKKPTLHSQVPLFKGGPEGPMPSLSLLDPPQVQHEAQYTDEVLREMSSQVESKLADFGVDAHVVAVHPGPVITRFELALAAGVKASKISGLAKDLARSLAIVSVRVVEIIPGKPYVGLELPNVHRQMVCLSELIASDAYAKSTSPLSLVLGKDIAGAPIVVDLGKMPHLLVAGTTGSGKSVGLNAMLLSILFKATPEDVRMILIDPKMLELAIYDNIPHLLAPVVTDVKEAGNALKWCVAEMERRYQLMAALGVRNLEGYNRKIKDAEKDNAPISDPLFQPGIGGSDEVAPFLTKLPFIVVVIDEFADMMMVVGKKVEELIARIAQKARAAGIHLILATQRPSVDVITGLIKANVPTRIAFQVASRIDSRTILDQQGAEQLLGRGDMLYLPVGAGIPVRVHGAFVSDQEVHAVVEDWKRRGTPEFEEGIISGHMHSSFAGAGFDGDGGEDDAEADPLYDQAVAVVLETRRASISMVQRRLKIGYNRAARLIEQMEAAGLVSAMQSNGGREVLVPNNA
ncbi:MAG: DNA translocase FtsK [Gammaproteobacteria bacterium]